MTKIKFLLKQNQMFILIQNAKNCNNIQIQTIMIFAILKIREENILSMKIRANEFDLSNAKRFNSFSSVIFNSKNKYCCFNKKLNNGFA